MRLLALTILGLLTLVGTASAQEAFEALVIVQPLPVAVQTDEERTLISDVNQVRESHGLADVSADPRLAEAALLHAQDMARRKYFGHDAPDGTSLLDRLAAIGYRWTVAAENIALDRDASHANAALLGSPEHLANILNPQIRRIGVAALRVGVGAALYVEDFAR